MSGTDADRVWSGSMPEAYERLLVPVFFRPFAQDMAGRVAALDPRRVLELAAGTGVLTEELLAVLPPVAQVVATDLNEAMVALGAVRAPGAKWRQADAQRLDFEAGSFDVVVCQFGAMFFPDRAAAFAEVRRVLRPGGRLLLSVWGPLERHGFGGAFQAGMERAFPTDPPRFLRDVPHGYHDPAEVTADLAAGGLEPEWHQTLTLEGRAESAQSVAEGFLTGTPARAEVESRTDSPDARVAARSVIVDEMTARLGPGPVTAEVTAELFCAHSPN